MVISWNSLDDDLNLPNMHTEFIVLWKNLYPKKVHCRGNCMWHTPMPQILWECPHCFSIRLQLLYIRSVWDNSLFFPSFPKIHIAQQQFCLWARSRGEFDDQWDKFVRISYSNCVWFLRQQLKPASSKSHFCYCFSFYAEATWPSEQLLLSFLQVRL